MASDLNVSRIETVTSKDPLYPGNDGCTVVLLHMDGPDAAVTFPDAAAGGSHTWTARTTAQVDTAQSMFGGASLLVDGNSDWIDTPTSTDFNFAAGDFTIDFWVKFASTAAQQGVVGSLVDTNNLMQIWFYGNTANFVYKWLFYWKNAGTIQGLYVVTDAQSDPGTTNWHHIAWVRNGSNAYFFLDGASIPLTQTNAWGTLTNINSVYQVGAAKNVAGVQTYFNGWIDEFRVSKGIARWTANFTPPDYPYGIQNASIQNFISAIDSLETVADVDPQGLEDIVNCIYLAENISATVAETQVPFLPYLIISRTEKVTMPDPTGITAGKVLLDSLMAMLTDKVMTIKRSPDSYTVSLLHMDGDNASTVFPDSAAAGSHAWTALGNASISTTKSKFGGASAYFDGTLDQIYTGDSADWAFGSGDFTVECWVCGALTEVQLYGTLVGQGTSLSNNQLAWTLQVHSADHKLHVYFWNSHLGTPALSTVASTTSLNDNAWHHIALIRNGNNLNLYVDGVAEGGTFDVTGVTFQDSGAALGVGCRGQDTGDLTVSHFTGYIDEVRISKGIARWTGNFTPPTSAYEDVDDSTIYTAILDHLEPPGQIETVTASEPAASVLLPTLIISIFDALTANEIYSPILDQLLIQASDAIESASDIPSSLLDALIIEMIEAITENDDVPQTLLSELLIQLLETISANDLEAGLYFDFVIEMLETITGSDENLQGEIITFELVIKMLETLSSNEALFDQFIDPLIVQAADAIVNSDISDQVLTQLIISLFETIAGSDISSSLLEELTIRILETITLSDEKRLTKEFLALRGEFLFNRFGRTAPSVTAGGNFKYSQNKTESPSRTPGGNFKYKKPKDN